MPTDETKRRVYVDSDDSSDDGYYDERDSPKRKFDDMFQTMMETEVVEIAETSSPGGLEEDFPTLMIKALQDVTSNNPNQDSLFQFRYMAMNSDYTRTLAHRIANVCRQANRISHFGSSMRESIDKIDEVLLYHHQLRQAVLSDMTKKDLQEVALDMMSKRDERSFQAVLDKLSFAERMVAPTHLDQTLSMLQHFRRFSDGNFTNNTTETPASQFENTTPVGSSSELGTTATKNQSPFDRDPLAIDLSAYGKQTLTQPLPQEVVSFRRNLVNDDAMTDYLVSLVHVLDQCTSDGLNADTTNLHEAMDSTRRKTRKRLRKNIDQAVEGKDDSSIFDMLSNLPNRSAEIMEFGPNRLRQVAIKLTSLADTVEKAQRQAKNLQIDYAT